MKTWIKRTLAGLFGATFLLGGLAACSHGPHHGPMAQMSEADAAKWRARIVERATDKLSLDATQQQRLGALVDTAMAQRQAMAATGNPREELKAVVSGTSFDRARAQSLVDGKLGSLREASPKLITAAADFYDSLKPEQQAKVREMMERGRRWGWRG